MKRIGVFSLAGLLVLFWYWKIHDRQAGLSGEGSDGPEWERPRSGANPKSASARIRLIEGNPFVTDYGRGGGSISSDLESLRDVVRDCQLLFKDFDRFHLPGHEAIISFLQGANPDGLAWIPPEHPMINEAGELVDREGRPVVFHRLSGTRFEYRSAGPDGKHWTGDDVVVK